ncbi:MAG: hypothetical protein IIB07_07960 [Bacteroidetes bacterium]|nr:hypothetical protein [Bacteroidota bacterium]MCH8942712.1 hypothetical protein [Bacteroidota bacterium]
MEESERENEKNPAFFDILELLEDISDLERAIKVKGKDLTLGQYLIRESQLCRKKRDLQNSN